MSKTISFRSRECKSYQVFAAAIFIISGLIFGLRIVHSIKCVPFG